MTLTSCRGFLVFRCTHYAHVVYRTIDLSDPPARMDCGCRIVKWEALNA